MAGFGNYEVDPNTGRPVITIPRPGGGGGQGGAGLTPFVPAEPTPPQQTGPTAQAAGLTPFTPGEQQPQREISAEEAAIRGGASGLTFGAAPAIAGLSAASGIAPTDEDFWQQPADVGGLARMAASPFVGAYKLATGDQPAQADYTKGREEALATQQEAQAQHPYAYLGGELGGSVAALPATFGTGAAAGLGARIGRAAIAGGVGGGLYGAGTSVSEGASPIDVAKATGAGAATGAVLGGGASAALEPVLALGSAVKSAVRGRGNIDTEAARRIAEGVVADIKSQGYPLTRQEISAANAAGTPRVIAHTGEHTRALARSAANTSPEARAGLSEFTQETFKGQSDRIGQFIGNLTGSKVDTEALKALGMKAVAPLYKRAYLAGDRRFPGGVTSNKLKQLLSAQAVEKAMGEAITTGSNRAVLEGIGGFHPKFILNKQGFLVRQKGVAPDAFPDMQLWDYTQRKLRDIGQSLYQAGHRDEGGAILGLHKQLNAELDKLVPEFGQARGLFRLFKGAEDAYEAGQNFVTMGADLDEARKALSKMNKVQRELFARGYATELQDKVSRVADSRNVLNAIEQNRDARAKTLLALGPQRAEDLAALLRAESVVDRLRTALGNSTTARQLGEAGLAGGAVATYEGLKEQSFNPVDIVAAAISVGLIRKGAQVIDQKLARRVGEMLVSDDPSILAKGIQLVNSRPLLKDALRIGSNASVRELVNQMGPSGIGAAALTLREHFAHEAPREPSANYGQDDQQTGPIQ